MKPEELPSTPSLRLDGRRALVTGAGRGIGVAAAAALAEAGAAVTLVARSREETEAVARAIGSVGGQAEAATLDVSDLDGFRSSDGFQALRRLASPFFTAPPQVDHIAKAI